MSKEDGVRKFKTGTLNRNNRNETLPGVRGIPELKEPLKIRLCKSMLQEENRKSTHEELEESNGPNQSKDVGNGRHSWSELSTTTF